MSVHRDDLWLSRALVERDGSTAVRRDEHLKMAVNDPDQLVRPVFVGHVGFAHGQPEVLEPNRHALVLRILLLPVEDADHVPLAEGSGDL